MATKILSRGRGRPTKYKSVYAAQAEKLCRLGMTVKNLATFFDVKPSTVSLWIRERDDFSESVKRGRELSDAEVVDSLYKLATGAYGTPNVVACLFWLKNRRPAQWRDKPAAAETQQVAEPVQINFVLDETVPMLKLAENQG